MVDNRRLVEVKGPHAFLCHVLRECTNADEQLTALKAKINTLFTICFASQHTEVDLIGELLFGRVSVIASTPHLLPPASPALIYCVFCILSAQLHSCTSFASCQPWIHLYLLHPASPTPIYIFCILHANCPSVLHIMDSASSTELAGCKGCSADGIVSTLTRKLPIRSMVVVIWSRPTSGCK